MSDLKPCPFCGSSDLRSAWIRASQEHQWYSIECVCDAQVQCLSEGEAYATWNARATPSTDAADIAEKVREAWRDGWDSCKSCLTDDEAFCLTDDVQHDAWLDSKTAALDLTDNGAPGVDRGEVG